MIRLPNRNTLIERIEGIRQSLNDRYGDRDWMWYKSYNKLLRDLYACGSTQEARKLWVDSNKKMDTDVKSYTERKQHAEYSKWFGTSFMQDYVPHIFNCDRNDEEYTINNNMRGHPLNRLHPNGKKVLTPIPTSGNTTDLETLMLDRAKQFKDTNDLFVLWSGGIDSTAVIHSLREVGTKFTIICDSDSIDENPIIAEQLITGSYSDDVSLMIRPTEDEYQTVLDNPNNTILTGLCGDEVFGGIGACVFLDEFEFEHWDEPFMNHLEQDLIDATYDSIKEIVKDVDSMTINEWRWAIHFIYKYQQIQISGMYTLGVDLVNLHDGHKGVHFYDTSEFNWWSINNYKLICGPEWRDKKLLKEFIFKLDGNEQFYKFKKKFCSMRGTHYRKGVEDVIMAKPPKVCRSFADTIRPTGQHILRKEI